MAKTQPQSTGLIQQLLGANSQTLEEIETEVATLEREIADFAASRKLAASRKQRLDALRTLERVIRKQDDYRRRIRELLEKEGSMPVPAIAARLGLHSVEVGTCVCRFPGEFCKTNGEVALAKKGA